MANVFLGVVIAIGLAIVALLSVALIEMIKFLRCEIELDKQQAAKKKKR